MGYMIDQRGAEFRIAAEHRDACLAAIKAIPLGRQNVGNGGGYSWVGEYQKATTLAEAFEEWRWDIEEGEPLSAGDVTDISFRGEKYGDDEVLWDAIAPFVDAGSYIEMQGEEGEVWRWEFRDGKCHVNYAKLVWE